MPLGAVHVLALGLALSRPSMLPRSPRLAPHAILATISNADPETMRIVEAERPPEAPMQEEELVSPVEEEIAASAESDGLAEGRLLMLVVACLWGTNFPAVKAILEAGLAPSMAAAARFVLAAVALSPLLKQGPKLERGLVLGGFECGAWLALGYIAQALALRDTPSAVVAFIASLQVVLVPLTQAAFGNGKLSPRLILSCLLCVGGVGLLELGPVVADMLTGGSGEASAGLTGLGAGSALALLQPVGFGVSYIRIEALMRRYPEGGLQLSSLQLISNAAIAVAWALYDMMSDDSVLAGVMSGLASLGAGAGAGSIPTELIAGVAYTGLVSTALTVVLQTRALGKLPAADSSVIVATEPLWAAGFAALLLGEMLAPASMVGGLLLLTGCITNTILPEQLTGAAPEETEPRGKAD